MDDKDLAVLEAKTKTLRAAQARAEVEKEQAQKNYDDTLKQLQEKYGVKDAKDITKVRAKLQAAIEAEEEKAREALKAAGLA